MDREKIYIDESERQVQIKTKIICTIGPKTQSVEKLASLIDAGMNIMRLNFSHGTHQYHGQTIANLRECLQGSKQPKQVAILLDTKGPEIRTGKLKEGKPVQLIAGNSFTFHNDFSRLGDETQVSTTYLSLAKTVGPGDRILVSDGLIGMSVVKANLETNEVECKIENDASLGETKGVNLPGKVIDLPGITEKDAADIRFGIEQGVDFIAASFVRKRSDVEEIRDLVKHANIKIISKIENQEGLDNFDDILEASDGIMVARGDLGVEVPVEMVFRYQKNMIRKCNFAGKMNVLTRKSSH